MMENKDISKSVGGRLQEAREAGGLSRVQAAESLRLRVSVVEAMETGNLDIGVPTTFVRGYIKNYARLLHVPLEAILPLLEGLQEDDDYESGAVPATDNPVWVGHFNWRRWLAFTVFAVGALFLFVYLR